MYLVKSGLNSSTSNRNKNQHCTEYKLYKHISIYRTEASKTRFEKSEKNRGIQNEKWHISANSHNYQIQDKALTVIALIALNKATTCTLIPVCTLLDHMPKNVQQFQIFCNMMNYKDSAKASKLHKVLSIYMERDSPYPKKL